MSFERKIAAQAIENPEPPALEPAKDQRGGVVEIRGGGIQQINDRGHKNWGQTINQGFELRSLMGTAYFLNALEDGVGGKGYGNLIFDTMTPAEIEIAPGDFAYWTVRALPSPSPASLLIKLRTPSGVPTSQIRPPLDETDTPRARERQRLCFVEIFYPQATTVSFSADFAMDAIVGSKAQHWVPEELDLLIGPGNPVSTALIVRDVVPQTLAELFVEPRLANTSDFFMFSYNERTGKTIAVLLASGMVGMDPEEPEPGTTEPVDDTDTTPTPPTPWSPPDQVGTTPVPPSTETDHDYTDPVTGLPVEVEVPSATATTVRLWALHADGISKTVDGGATWEFVPAPDVGNLVDIAAGPAGVIVLNDVGQAFYTQTFGVTPFEEIVVPGTTETAEIALENPGFETGDLTGWTPLTVDVPRPLRTTTPPQRPGSTHYLTRDWRLVNPQPFAVEQRVQLTEKFRASSGAICASVDVLCENEDIAKIQILDGAEIIVADTAFTVTRSGNNFRANGFATSPVDGPLNLVGVGSATVGNWINRALPIWLEGNSGQSVSGSIAWRVEKADGSLYDGLVVLRLYDVDSPETLTIEGVEDYDLLTSSVSATYLASKKYRFSGGVSDGTTGDIAGARIHVTVASEFSFALTGVTQSAIGLKGPGAGAVHAPAMLASAQVSSPEWTELRAEYTGDKPAWVKIQLTGVAVGGYADVFFDNVRLFVDGVPVPPVATAIAHVEGEFGGADIYAGDTVVEHLRRLSEPPNGHTLDAPDGVVFAATTDTVDAKKLATDGLKAWAWDGIEDGWQEIAAGEITSVCGFPLVAVAFETGEVVNRQGEPIGTFAPSSRLSGDRRRMVLLATSPAGAVVASDGIGGTVFSTSQPVSADATFRHTLASDSGRYLGFDPGSRDFYWTDVPQTGWKLGGALSKPIQTIVEYR